jgi:hypothetical protein
VNEYTSADGEKRIWFTDDEIEQMMEEVLRRANLMPTEADCVVDLETLVDSHLHVSLFDQHADLPADVLGVTEFHPRKPPKVRINKDLTGIIEGDWIPPGIEGRWRATVAHEAAHVILHRMLFDEDLDQASLFGAGDTLPAKPTLQRCLKRDLKHRTGNYDWREVQANKGMAALLMPRKLFTKVARSTLRGSSAQEIREASRALAATFGVSAQAAAIRLSTLGFVSDQDTLALDVEP